MMRLFATLRPVVWLLLFGVIGSSLLSNFIRNSRVIDSSLNLYVLEPALAVVLATVAYAYAGKMHDRIRHKGEKALIIISVITVWFVLYFLLGLFMTYVHNAVASSLTAILINTAAFGIGAAALEYVRNKVMLMGSRRTLIPLGILVGIVFAFGQISLHQIFGITSAVGAVEFIVQNIVPALASSFLLTYLAVTSGLPSQLAFRLGVLFLTLIPPIIPKFDWYLIGVSQVALVMAVYIVIDRLRVDTPIRGRRYKHTERAYDVMFLVVFVALVLFMTGVFTYKPLAIMSNSMQPVFSRGSIVVVQKVKAMDVKEGDIIQYEGHGKMVTHRVIKASFADDGSGTRILTTKGDNSPSPDAPVQEKQVVGVVKGQIPLVGYPTVWMSELAKKK